MVQWLRVEARDGEVQVQLPAPPVISDGCGVRFILAMSLRNYKYWRSRVFAPLTCNRVARV